MSASPLARRMGFRVVAIGRGSDIADDARTLGAHVYLDAGQQDAPARLQEIGGAQAILSTIGDAATVSVLLAGPALRGRPVPLGAGKDSLAVSAGPLVVGRRSVMGSVTGSPVDKDKTLNFSVLAGVRPLIETMPLARAYGAYSHMKSGNVKFRMVLTMHE